MNMPCPLTARSRFESVNSMLPCANCCATAATRTPLPLALLDTPCSDTANRSANSAREPLKPLVDVLAMLLAVTFEVGLGGVQAREGNAKWHGVISCEFFSGYSTRSTSLMAISPRVSVSSMSAPVAGSSATLETLGRDAGVQRNVLVADLGDDFDLVGAGRRAARRRRWCRPR